MATAMGLCSAVISSVSTPPTMANSHTDEPTIVASSLPSFAPEAIPMSTVMPVVSPSMMPVTVCITWLPMATPATLAASSNHPTTNRSAPPYNACSTLASR